MFFVSKSVQYVKQYTVKPVKVRAKKKTKSALSMNIFTTEKAMGCVQCLAFAK